MSERLPEFNRYALRKKLQNETETKELVEQVRQLVQSTYLERYDYLGYVSKYSLF